MRGNVASQLPIVMLCMLAGTIRLDNISIVFGATATPTPMPSLLPTISSFPYSFSYAYDDGFVNSSSGMGNWSFGYNSSFPYNFTNFTNFTGNSSLVPTLVPSSLPTISFYPTVSLEPTFQPTLDPSFSHLPTSIPTSIPSLHPTRVPSPIPISRPTRKPTRQPTVPPSPGPTPVPAPGTAKPTNAPRPLLQIHEAIGVTIAVLFLCMLAYFLLRPRFTDWQKTSDPCDFWVRICGDKQTQDALQTLMGHQEEAGQQDSGRTALNISADHTEQENPLVAGARQDVEMGQQLRLLNDDASVGSSSSSVSSYSSSAPSEHRNGQVSRIIRYVGGLFHLIRQRAEPEPALPQGPTDELGNWLESVHKGFSFQYHETLTGLGYGMNDFQGIPDDELMDLIDDLSNLMPTEDAARLNSALLRKVEHDRKEAEEEKKNKEPQLTVVLEGDENADNSELSALVAEDEEFNEAIERSQVDAAMAESLKSTNDNVEFEVEIDTSENNNKVTVNFGEGQGGETQIFNAAGDSKAELDMSLEDEDIVLQGSNENEVDEDDSNVTRKLAGGDDFRIEIEEQEQKQEASPTVSSEGKSDEEDDDLKTGIAMSLSIMSNDNVGDKAKEANSQGAKDEIEDKVGDEADDSTVVQIEGDKAREEPKDSLIGEDGEKDKVAGNVVEEHDEELHMALAMSESLEAAKLSEDERSLKDADGQPETGPLGVSSELSRMTAEAVADLDMRERELKTHQHISEQVDRRKVIVSKWLEELEAGFASKFEAIFAQQGYHTLGDLIGMPEDELMELVDILNDAHPEDTSHVNQISNSLIQETITFRRNEEQIRKAEREKEREKMEAREKKRELMTRAEQERIEQRILERARDNAKALEAHNEQIALADAEVEKVETALRRARRAGEVTVAAELLLELATAKAKQKAITEGTELERDNDAKANDTLSDEDDDDGDREDDDASEQEKRSIGVPEEKINEPYDVSRRSSQAAQNSLEAFVAMHSATNNPQNDDKRLEDDEDASNPPEKPLSARELAISNVQDPKEKKSLFGRFFGSSKAKLNNKEVSVAEEVGDTFEVEDPNKNPSEVELWLDRIEEGLGKEFGKVFEEGGYQGMMDLVGIPEDELLDLIEEIRGADAGSTRCEKITSLLLVMASHEPLPQWSDDDDRDNHSAKSEKGSVVSDLSEGHSSDGEIYDEDTLIRERRHAAKVVQRNRLDGKKTVNEMRSEQAAEVVVGEEEIDESDPVNVWLDNIRAGYGDRFSSTFKKLGYKTVNSFAGISPQEITAIITVLRSQGEKKPTLKRIMDTLAADAQQRMMDAFKVGLDFSSPPADDDKVLVGGKLGDTKKKKRNKGKKKRRKYKLDVVETVQSENDAVLAKDPTIEENRADLAAEDSEGSLESL